MSFIGVVEYGAVAVAVAVQDGIDRIGGRRRTRRDKRRDDGVQAEVGSVLSGGEWSGVEWEIGLSLFKDFGTRLAHHLLSSTCHYYPFTWFSYLLYFV